MIPQGPADASGFDAADQATRLLRGTLVGIVDGPSELQDGYPLVAFPAGVLDLRDVGDVGVSATVNVVSLEPGATLDDLRAQLDELPDASQFGIDRGDWVPSVVRSSVSAYGQGLAVLAGIAAVATIVVVGQLLSRQVRLVGGRAPRAALDGHDPWPGRGGSTARCSRLHGGRGRGRRRSRLSRVRPLPHRLRPPRRARSRPPVRGPGAAPRRLRRGRHRPRHGCSWRSSSPAGSRPVPGRRPSSMPLPRGRHGARPPRSVSPSPARPATPRGRGRRWWARRPSSPCCSAP